MKFIVYRASAGSGKTYTLVREYLKMALNDDNPLKFKNILAITFTNKAAAEMKERVILMLKKLSIMDETLSNAEKNLFYELRNALNLTDNQLKIRSKNILNAILHNYGDFSICTIDSFMHRVVRTFAKELKIPVNFSVELSNDIIIQTAVAEILEKVGKDDAITRALIGFTEYKTDEEKNMQIEDDISDTAADLLKEQTIREIKKISNLSVDEFIKTRRELEEKCNAYEKKLLETGKKCLKILRDSGLESGDFYQTDSGIARFFNNLGFYQPGSALEIKKFLLDTLNHDKWTSGKADSTAKKAIEAKKDELADLAWSAIHLIRNNQASYLLDFMVKNSLYTIAVLNELYKVIEHIREQESIIHISEFNQRVSEIVFSEPAPFIYERLGERYQHFLIDEFQDTSILQWQNMLPLIENGLSNGNTSLIVGDGKQAIYRFRGGDVEQFSNLPKPYPADIDNIKKYRYESLARYFSKPDDLLDTNYRSKSNIVDFNNRLYKFLSEKILDAEQQKIYADIEQKASKIESGGYIRIDFIPKNSESGDEPEGHPEKTVEIINELRINKKYRPRDIVILTRTGNQGTKIAQILLKNKIPVISNESLLVESSNEVGFLVSWLHILNGENVSVNRLNICNYLITKTKLPYADLDTFIARHNPLPEITFYEIMKNAGFDFQPEKIRNHQLPEICNIICRIFEIQPRNNPHLQFFLEAVWSLSNKSATDISMLLEWWNENRPKLSICMPTDSDAVRIMSVHKSKGLQFPVVIIPFALSHRKIHVSTQWVEDREKLPENLPAARIPLSKTLLSTDLANLYNEEKKKNTLDALNLLYVATTRPEDALIILTGRTGKNETATEGWEKYLEAFVGNDKITQKPQGKFEWGNPDFINERISEELDQIIEKDDNQKDNGSYETGNWQSRISFRRQANVFWDTEKETDSMDFGNLVHTIMGSILVPEDIEPTIDRFIDTGAILKKNKEKLIGLIRTITNHPLLEEYYGPGLTILNEKEIMLEDGSIIRPDRVVMKNEQIMVIDYKTGIKTEKHSQQIKKYLQSLAKLYNANPSGLIVYLNEWIRIETVSL